MTINNRNRTVHSTILAIWQRCIPDITTTTTTATTTTATGLVDVGDRVAVASAARK